MKIDCKFIYCACLVRGKVVSKMVFFMKEGQDVKFLFFFYYNGLIGCEYNFGKGVLDFKINLIDDSYIREDEYCRLLSPLNYNNIY